MAVGLSVVNLANRILNHLVGGEAWSRPAGLFAQIHKGSPGAAGTANASVVTARKAMTFGAASGGAVDLSGSFPVWEMTAAETISHVSVHSAASGGDFQLSAALSEPKQVGNGDTLTLQSFLLSFGPLAS